MDITRRAISTHSRPSPGAENTSTVSSGFASIGLSSSLKSRRWRFVRALTLGEEAPISSLTDRRSRSSICAPRRSRRRRRVAWSALGTVASTSVAAAVSNSTKTNSASLPMGTSRISVGRPISRGLLPPTALAASEAGRARRANQSHRLPSAQTHMRRSAVRDRAHRRQQRPARILASRSSVITPAMARGNPGVVTTDR